MSTTLTLSPEQLARFNAALRDDKKPDVLLFRILGPQLQLRFTELLDLSGVPRLLLHGNPHLDNYARTLNGAGLLDFDRSRVGPSLWDVVRALCSITFWSGAEQVRPHVEVSACLFNAYQRAIEDRLAYWEAPDLLRQVKPKKFQMTSQRYLKSGKKWVKKLHEHSVEPDEPFYEGLFQSYLESLPEGALSHWELSEVAEVAGSMGKRHYVYLLSSLTKSREPILLDIKETYSELDSEHFHNPFEHEGERMVTASRIYSPGLEERIGFCSYQGEDYWVRQIPSFSAKVPVGIDHDESMQLAQAIGLQLGRGHRVIDEIYSDGQHKQGLISAVAARRDELIELSAQLNREVLDLYEELTRS